MTLFAPIFSKPGSDTKMSCPTILNKTHTHTIITFNFISWKPFKKFLKQI